MTSRARMQFDGSSRVPVLLDIQLCNGRVIDVERPPARWLNSVGRGAPSGSRAVEDLPDRPCHLLSDRLTHELPREILRARRGLAELPREREPEIAEVGH